MSSLNRYFTILIGFFGFLIKVNCKVRGIAGKDYPNYSIMPRTSFKCSEQLYNPGYYADPETRCQVFHYCYKHRKESFLCPPGTIFNQAILSCDYWYSSDCQVSLSLYNINSNNKNAYVFPEKSWSMQKNPSDVLFSKMESLYELSNQTEDRSNASKDQHIENIFSRELQIGENTEGDLVEHVSKVIDILDTKEELPILNSKSQVENNENLSDLDESGSIEHLAVDFGDDTEQYFFSQNEQKNKLFKRTQETVDNTKHSRSKHIYTILEPENTTLQAESLPSKIRKKQKILVNHGISNAIDFNDKQNIYSEEIVKETDTSGALQNGGATYTDPSLKLKRKKIVFLSNEALETKLDAPTHGFDENTVDDDKRPLYEAQLKTKQVVPLKTRKNNKMLILNETLITSPSDNNDMENKIMEDKPLKSSRRKKKLMFMDDITPIKTNIIEELKSELFSETELGEVSVSSVNKHNSPFGNLYHTSIDPKIDQVSNLINAIEGVNENRINQIENKVKVSDAIEQISESGNHKETRNTYRMSLYESENAKKAILGSEKSNLPENIVEKNYLRRKLPLVSDLASKDILNTNASQGNFTLLKDFKPSNNKSDTEAVEHENVEDKSDGHIEKNVFTRSPGVNKHQESYVEAGESENLHSPNHSSSFKLDDMEQEAYKIISDEKKSFDANFTEFFSDDSTARSEDAFYHYITTESTWNDVLGSGDEDLKNVQYEDTHWFDKKMDPNLSVPKNAFVMYEIKEPSFYDKKLRSFHLAEESENFNIYTDFSVDEAEQYTEQSLINELDDLTDTTHYKNHWTDAPDYPVQNYNLYMNQYGDNVKSILPMTYDFELGTSPSTHFRESYLFEPTQHPIYKEYSDGETITSESSDYIHFDGEDTPISNLILKEQNGIDSGSKKETSTDSTNIKPYVFKDTSFESTDQSSAYEDIEKSFYGKTYLPQPFQIEKKTSHASLLASDTNESVVKFTEGNVLKDKNEKIDKIRELTNVVPNDEESHKTPLVSKTNEMDYSTSFGKDKINLNALVRNSRSENTPVNLMNSMAYTYNSPYFVRYGKTRPSKIVQLIQIGKMLLKMKRSKLNVLKDFLNTYAIDL